MIATLKSRPAVIVISLLRSVERRERITRLLDDLGLEFSFFEAIDGRS